MEQQNKDLILLILDMQGIEDRLREFERKYRLRSSVFYQLVKEGKIEQRLELVLPQNPITPRPNCPTRPGRL
jgi:hypothetical protein